jgi:hypothetical protein
LIKDLEYRERSQQENLEGKLIRTNQIRKYKKQEIFTSFLIMLTIMMKI